MTADPGKRVTGQGVIDPDPVVINNSWDNNTNELFLLYKTQSGTGQATIRMVRVDMTPTGPPRWAPATTHQLLAAIPTGSGGSYQVLDADRRDHRPEQARNGLCGPGSADVARE
jgi:hypothetical protein